MPCVHMALSQAAAVELSTWQPSEPATAYLDSQLPHPHTGELPASSPPLQVRCALPHIEAMYADDPLWDLSAPRAACEAYIAAGERGL